MDSELHDQTYFVLSTTGIRTMLERGCPCQKEMSQNIGKYRCCTEEKLCRGSMKLKENHLENIV